jgi:3-methyladenine DNA glycosylase/8-oxoguanine DNA glycosylase
VLSTVVGLDEVSFQPRGRWLAVSGGGANGTGSLSAVARRVFSLDLDLSPFDAALADDPGLRRALRRGGGRLLRAPSLFEDAVKMLLTTNCSWAATRGMVERLIAIAGEEGRAFPTPGAVARLSPAVLRNKVRCGYRAQALSRFARRVACGKLDLAAWERRTTPAEEVREAILAEHGFGPYAAEGVLRILGRHEYLALDSWVRKQYRRLHPGPSRTVDRAIARRYARFGEYKGLALWLEMTMPWHEGDSESWPKE